MMKDRTKKESFAVVREMAMALCKTEDAEGAKRCGLKYGWLSREDSYAWEETLDRQRASCIVHAYLQRVSGEADEEDWQRAFVLADLLDCRRCAGHVAQIYLKGIIGAKMQIEENRFVFGMREPVTRQELTEIIARIFEPQRRLTVQTVQERETQAKVPRELVCDRKDADRLQEIYAGWMIVDVRSREEYLRWHPAGAVNYPFMTLLENPRLPGIEKGTPVLLCCDAGTRSKAVAERLTQDGWKRVAWLGFGDVRRGEEFEKYL